MSFLNRHIGKQSSHGRVAVEASRLAAMPGCWVLGDSPENRLKIYFHGHSPYTFTREVEHFQRVLAEIPSSKDEFSQVVDRVVASTRDGTSPHIPTWVQAIPTPRDYLEDIKDIGHWQHRWITFEWANEILLWNKEIESILAYWDLQQSKPALMSRRFQLELERFKRSCKQFRQRVEMLPSDWRKRRLLAEDTRKRFTDIIQQHEHLKDAQVKWERLFQEADDLIAKGQAFKNLGSAWAAMSRLKALRERPDHCPYAFEELEQALEEVTSAVCNREEGFQTLDEEDSELFLGGEDVWEDLAKDPLPTERDARLKDLLVRSDELVLRSKNRYLKLVEQVSGIPPGDEWDAQFLQLLKPDRNSSLKEILEWLKKSKVKQEVKDNFKRLSGGGRNSGKAAKKLNKLYRDKRGLYFKGLLDILEWWSGKDIAVPLKLPRWVDEMMDGWVESKEEVFLRRLPNKWNPGFLALAIRLPHALPFWKRYVDGIWSGLSDEERQELWLILPGTFQKEWAQHCAARWFAGKISSKKIERDLSFFSKDEEGEIFKIYLQEDPLPDAYILRRLLRDLGEYGENLLGNAALRLSDTASRERRRELVSLAVHELGESLRLERASPIFLEALLEAWGNEPAESCLHPALIGEACCKLALRGEVSIHLGLLVDSRISISSLIKRVNLSRDQWQAMSWAFDEPEWIDSERIEVLISQCDPTNIPECVWLFFVNMLKQKGEEHLKKISMKCVRVLEYGMQNLADDIGRLSGIIYWAYRFFTRRCEAEDIPDSVLEIEGTE